jgi:large subunit ribosomal protein L4
MLSIPIFNESGAQVGAEQLDEALLGGQVNPALLKQAVVMYQSNLRQGDACTKTRAQVEGSTRKVYRQKGTGRARRGPIRTPIMRGGGRAFPTGLRNFHLDMPRKMKRLARNQAVLAKIQSQDAIILDGFKPAEPKTKRFATMLKATQSDRGCVVATAGLDPVVFKSGRNVPRTAIKDVAQLTALDILSRRRLIFTRDAFNAFRAGVTKGGSD